MQPITPEELKELIEEAKKAGKDVSKLEKALAEAVAVAPPPLGERKEKKVKEGKRVIESTGPAREEDFK